MKILEINKFYNAKRGADKHFMDVTALLKGNGHEVAVFSMHQAGNEYSAWEKYFVSTVGYTGAFSAWEKIKGALRMFFSFESHQKIKALLEDFQPDIVHVHNIYHQLDPTILFEIKKRGIPIVMTVHDFKLINPNHSLRLDGKPYRRCAKNKYYQCFLDKCVKNSFALSFLASMEMYWHFWLGTYEKNVDLYLAPSEFAKRILVEWGMDDEKIMVLPHFIPTIGRHGSNKYSFSASGPYAIYAGKISKEKGVDTLVEIFKKQTGIKLYLAGEIELGYELPKHESIVNLGFLNADLLAAYVDNCTFVVSGSQLPETFGLVALESISAGKAFIGFNSGAYSEIVEHGVSGMIAKSKKEFEKFIKEIASEKIVFDSRIIKAKAAKYDIKRYLQNLEEIMSIVIYKNSECNNKIGIDKD